MKVKIYGGGCDKCRQLLENAQAALDVAGIDAEIEKVTDMKAIAEAGVLMTPALEIDGKLVSSGRVLSSTEILPLLPEDAQQASENCSCCSCRGDGKTSSASCACAETASDSSAKCCCGKTSSPGKRLLVYLLLTMAAVAVAILLMRRCG